jgi:outer membrane protein assembly factor BamB
MALDDAGDRHRAGPAAGLRRRVLVSTIDGVVQLLDRNDGTVRWRYRTPGELRLAPVVASGALIVADQSGQLARVDADGREVWSVGHTKPLQVAVAGDTVVVSPHAGSLVSAFRFDDGGPAWQLRPDSALTDILAIDGVLVSRSSDDVQGLDPSTGDVLWRRPLVALGIAGGGHRLLVVSDSGLTILEPATGRTLVERPHGLGALSRTSFFVSSGGGRLVVSTSGKAAVGSLP